MRRVSLQLWLNRGHKEACAVEKREQIGFGLFHATHRVRLLVGIVCDLQQAVIREDPAGLAKIKDAEVKGRLKDKQHLQPGGLRTHVKLDVLKLSRLFERSYGLVNFLLCVRGIDGLRNQMLELPNTFVGLPGDLNRRNFLSFIRNVSRLELLGVGAEEENAKHNKNNEECAGHMAGRSHSVGTPFPQSRAQGFRKLLRD